MWSELFSILDSDQSELIAFDVVLGRIRIRPLDLMDDDEPNIFVSSHAFQMVRTW